MYYTTCLLSTFIMYVCDMYVCDMYVCDMYVCDMYVCDMYVCDMYVCDSLYTHINVYFSSLHLKEYCCTIASFPGSLLLAY